MRHIKRYSELFESEGKLTKRQIEFLDRYTEGKWTLNPSTGLVDVDGHFNCINKKITDFTGVRFGRVTGDFDFRQNKITSMDGVPKEVGRHFICYDNNLTSLKGSPEEVGGSFWCYKNKLASLEGAPKEVGGSFTCFGNKLTSLEGAPKRVGGIFGCVENKLTSLKGAPQVVGGDFLCYGNNLITLEGAPKNVGGKFYLDNDSGFKWTPKGKLEFISERPEFSGLIATTISHVDVLKVLLKVVHKNPQTLAKIEGSDKELYDKVLKELGWDKMGPDMLRHIKSELI